MIWGILGFIDYGGHLGSRACTYGMPLMPFIAIFVLQAAFGVSSFSKHSYCLGILLGSYCQALASPSGSLVWFVVD